MLPLLHVTEGEIRFTRRPQVPALCAVHKSIKCMSVEVRRCSRACRSNDELLQNDGEVVEECGYRSISC